MDEMIPMLLLALLVVATSADAQALVDRGPFDPALLVTYGWVVLISLLGGFASFYRKVKMGHARWINLGELAGELATSALAGMLTYWLARWAGIGDWATAACVGIAGHMGSRALFIGERLLEKFAARYVGPEIAGQLLGTYPECDGCPVPRERCASLPECPRGVKRVGIDK